VYDVHDWAEVHRLSEREHLNKATIARRLGMSRPTVIRLLEHLVDALAPDSAP
jgi:DNA-binding transcriptional regulator LsrR (DeoR family)